MHSRTLAITCAAILISAVFAYGAEPCGTSGCMISSPPARPAQLTAAQLAALQSMQTLPEHTRILEVPATYSEREEALEFTRFSDDFWTVVYQAGWPGTYLGFLICAL